MNNTTKAFLLLPFFLWLATCCQAQQKSISEEAFTAEIDQWMSPYRQEQRSALSEWFAIIREDPAAGRDHPVFRHMQAFCKEHRQEYRQLRLQSLQHCPSRPASFPGYQPVDTRLFWKGEKSLDSVIAFTQEMGNIRMLNVEATGAMQGAISALIVSWLRQEQGRDLRELSRLQGFGSLILADQAGPDTWNIAYVNRCYILNYQWNIDNNQISKFSVLVHDGTRQQPGWLQGLPFKADSPARQLSQDATALLWKFYDDMLTKNDYENETALEEKLQHFIDSRRTEYIQVRTAMLRRKPPCKDGWKAGYLPADTLRNNVLYLLGIPQQEPYNKLRPATALREFDCNYLFTTFQALVNKETGSNEGLLASWLAGREVYARQLKGHLWEIQGFYQRYVITYTWNIATDAIDNLQCWKR